MAEGVPRRHPLSWLTDANYTISPSFMFNFVRTQFRTLPLPTEDFSGKNVIVTGANCGLGLEAARWFTQLGAAKVILGCRDVDKAEAARADIEASTGRKGVVETWHVDLGSFQSVKDFCRRADALGRLDVVVENAAIATGNFDEKEGYESSITINVISTFLMAALLLPVMRKTAARFNVRPHICIVSSDAHVFARFRERSHPNVFDAFKGRANMNEDRYNTSKLLTILITRQMAQEMGQHSPVIINSLNPGLCRTDLFRHATFFLGIIIGIGLLIFGRTSEMGSRTLLAAAVAGEKSHGEYMDACEVASPSKFVTSDEGQKVQPVVYEQLMAILEGIEPGVTKNIGGSSGVM